MLVISEILKKEDGQIIFSRLSYKKMLLRYPIDIISYGFKVGQININLRYKIEQDNKLELIPQREPLYNKISNKYGIKKKHIVLNHIKCDDFYLFDSDQFKFDNIVGYIELNDDNWFKSWKRDVMINTILS
jgi:hypothetical protein